MVRFKELEIWNSGKEIAIEIYKISNKFPMEEKYGISSQMQRAAVSVPSNIAEGSGRQYNKEFIQFLNLSKGSLYELMTQLEIVYELNYINESDFKGINEKCIILAKRINAMIKSLKDK